MAGLRTEAARRAGSATRRRVRAFGLEIDTDFPAPGLPEAVGDSTGPTTRVDLVPGEEIDRDWPSEDAERVLEERLDGDEAPARTIDVHPQAGYRLYARHFGLARISPDGGRILCAPPGAAEWDWQRFLVGRILPWAAVLNGYETLHAGAVSIDGRAVAFVGPTGAGKTSLALRLVTRGAEFLTDDVLAVDIPNGAPRAHPGAGIASVRPAERDAIDADVWGGLGTVLGDSGKVYIEVPRVDGPRPLGAIYFLRTGDHPTIEPMGPPDPRRLLASTFVLGVRTPARLSNQLDVCAAIARDVPAFHLRVSRVVDAGGLATAVTEHLASLGVGP